MVCKFKRTTASFSPLPPFFLGGGLIIFIFKLRFCFRCKIERTRTVEFLPLIFWKGWPKAGIGGKGEFFSFINCVLFSSADVGFFRVDAVGAGLNCFSLWFCYTKRTTYNIHVLDLGDIRDFGLCLDVPSRLYLGRGKSLYRILFCYSSCLSVYFNPSYQCSIAFW